uniref:FAR1 DNA binding domain-containing protein n=1 Tax=Tanacetum cinerariifolium TaxID=118510 RepID=A0A6L2J922_TANCI|nr:FAR1 DNA binding domain-containing protein [Tanacetum cinerariifolium]
MKPKSKKTKEKEQQVEAKKRARNVWSEEEELILAESSIQISKDPRLCCPINCVLIHRYVIMQRRKDTPEEIQMTMAVMVCVSNENIIVYEHGNIKNSSLSQRVKILKKQGLKKNKLLDLGPLFHSHPMCMITPRATLYEHNETPGGSIYWEPRVEGIPIPVEGDYYDTIDEALDMYTKYAEMAGFEIKKGGQRLTKSGAYRVENCELVAMFWADEVAKCNYKEFGDIVSFDATFNSNKYNMNFVPFIGIDNHRKCVTLVYGLMRTTSRSESENSFFKSFTTPGETLVSFMMSYESAMERQMYKQEALDFKTIEAALKCKAKLAIELHAARVYTRMVFLLVQTEIKGCWNCTIQDLKIDKGCETVIIRDKKPNDNRLLFHKKREKNKRRKLKQWEKQRETIRDIIPPDLRRQRKRYGEKLTTERLTNEANFLVDDSLFLLSKDEGKMGTYVEKLKILLDEIKADMPNPPSRNTEDVIGGILSITKPNQIAVQNPTQTVNK